MFSKIRYWYLIFWLLILLWWYYYYDKYFITKEVVQTVKEIKVKQWDIVNTIEVVGNADLVDEQQIRFNQLWTVTKVNYKEWDHVKKLDIIAELDKTQINNTIKQSEIDFQNSKIKLSQLYDKPDESLILKSQKDIKNLQSTLQIKKDELKSLEIEKQTNIDQLQNDLDFLDKQISDSETKLKQEQFQYNTMKSEQDLSVNDTLSNNKKTINSIKIKITDRSNYNKKALIDIDKLLWVTDANKEYNDNFEANLWVKKSLTYIDAKDVFMKIKVASDKFTYDSTNDDLKYILDNLNEQLTIYENLFDLTTITLDVLDYSVSDDSFTDSDISSWKSIVEKYQSASTSNIDTINGEIDSINTLSDIDILTNNNTIKLDTQNDTIRSLEDSIAKNKKDRDIKLIQLEQKKKDYDTKLISKQNEIDDTNRSIEYNKKSLDELLEWPTPENVTLVKNDIKQREFAIQKNQNDLEKYELIAPFDWVIKSIDYRIGDNLLSDSDKYVYIENPDLVEITVLLDQIDVVKVWEWYDVIIVFDAYPDIEVKWLINRISYVPINQSWVISYEAKIIMNDPNFDKKIYSWMTANVSIIYEKKQWVLMIPYDAVQHTWNINQLLLKTNKWNKLVNINLWSSQNGMVEVIDWVSLGDTVLIIKTSWSTSTSQSSSIFPFWWWRTSWWSSWINRSTWDWNWWSSFNRSWWWISR